jgi:isoleucyl-tRNA synthetase
VLHDGPPYANGQLHMGHAVNKILKDITLKHHIASRTPVNYIPGWDCHGLPIELKATKAADKLTPVEIRTKARKFACATLEKQKAEFAQWGVTADWDGKGSVYRTLDVSYVQKQLQLFYELYRKGLIYRDMKPVYWSPSSRTALAEAELEYDPNYESQSLYLRLKLQELPEKFRKIDKPIYAIIWTTTPWSLPANQAVSYSEDLVYSLVQLEGDLGAYYLIASDLLAQMSTELGRKIEEVEAVQGSGLEMATYTHPIDASSCPFLPASHVQVTKGTGLVHTAPSHGPDDYLVALKHKIPLKCLVDEDGLYNSDAPKFLQGHSVLKEGSQLILSHLAPPDILECSKFIHSYAIDWRTKEPVLFRASAQWFINTEALKAQAIEEIRKMEIFPKQMAGTNKETLTAQLAKRPYWCISRQRVWGVPIPVFYDKVSNRELISEKTVVKICSKLEATGSMDFWWDEKAKEEILTGEVLEEFGVAAADVETRRDILDIWFDSGISWHNVLEGDRVADLYLEGVDQFTGWFQSSLLTSVAQRGVAPYKSVFVHGFAVDAKGHKMSKSLGNVILPKDIIGKFGVDALRWWVAAHATQHSTIPVSPKLLESSQESVHKVRAIFKFLLGCIEPSKAKGHRLENNEHLWAIDRYALHSLLELHDQVQALYETYQYNRVPAVVNNFLANNLSSVYMHLIKDRLYCGTAEENELLCDILKSTFDVLCKCLWPVVPFLVEESWGYQAATPFYQSKVEVPAAWRNPEAVRAVQAALDLRSEVFQANNDVNSWTLKLEVLAPAEKLSLLKVIVKFRLLQMAQDPDILTNIPNFSEPASSVGQMG